MPVKITKIPAYFLIYFEGIAELDCLVFFFQAEDGIRDGTVTGVQTCALPIFLASACFSSSWLARSSSRVLAFSRVICCCSALSCSMIRCALASSRASDCSCVGSGSADVVGGAASCGVVCAKGAACAGAACAEVTGTGDGEGCAESGGSFGGEAAVRTSCGEGATATLACSP